MVKKAIKKYLMGIWIPNIKKLDFTVSEYWTGLVFKWSTLDHLNTKFHKNSKCNSSCYSHLSTGPEFKWHSKSGPFTIWTTFNHLKFRYVQYSDPRCIKYFCVNCSLNAKFESQWKSHKNNQVMVRVVWLQCVER